jgi:hypothetical protein
LHRLELLEPEFNLGVPLGEHFLFMERFRREIVLLQERFLGRVDDLQFSSELNNFLVNEIGFVEGFLNAGNLNLLFLVTGLRRVI